MADRGHSRLSRGYCDVVMSPTLNVTMTMPYSELEVWAGKLEYLYPPPIVCEHLTHRPGDANVLLTRVWAHSAGSGRASEHRVQLQLGDMSLRSSRPCHSHPGLLIGHGPVFPASDWSVGGHSASEQCLYSLVVIRDQIRALGAQGSLPGDQPATNKQNQNIWVWNVAEQNLARSV